MSSAREELSLQKVSAMHVTAHTWRCQGGAAVRLFLSGALQRCGQVEALAIHAECLHER